MTGLDKLMNQIFDVENYNLLVRPMNEEHVTNVELEIKLHQIDLVREFYYTSQFERSEHV